MENTQPIDEREEKLIKEAIQVFMTYGIKSVTMDDIARHMRISKKTIYKYVKDKNDLVHRCLTWDCTVSEKQIKEIVAQKLNAIDEKFAISSLIVEDLRNIHPSIFYDLEKYYPEAWERMHELRHDFVGVVVLDNIQRGMAEGLYREDLNPEIITRLWIARLNVIFDPNLFPMQQFKLPEVYEQMFIHHIRGIASQKGLDYLDSKRKN